MVLIFTIIRNRIRGKRGGGSVELYVTNNCFWEWKILKHSRRLWKETCPIFHSTKRRCLRQYKTFWCTFCSSIDFQTLGSNLPWRVFLNYFSVLSQFYQSKGKLLKFRSNDLSHCPGVGSNPGVSSKLDGKLWQKSYTQIRASHIIFILFYKPNGRKAFGACIVHKWESYINVSLFDRWANLTPHCFTDEFVR